MARHGENIRKRSDGRWEGRYIIYLPGKGKQQKSVYGKTYSEVKKKKIQALDSANCLSSYSIHPKNITGKKVILFGNVADEWLTKIEITKKPSTYIKYLYIYNTYLKKLLSEYPLNNLDSDYFQNILARETAGCSESIQKKVFTPLFPAH